MVRPLIAVSAAIEELSTLFGAQDCTDSLWRTPTLSTLRVDGPQSCRSRLRRPAD